MDDYVIIGLISSLTPMALGVILPTVIVWMITRARIKRDNLRKEIILAAMEKNSDIDIEEMMKKLNGPKKLLKEKLLTRLLFGSIFVGLGILIYVAMAVYMRISKRFDTDMFIGLSIVAVPSLAVGTAFLTNYFAGKNMLAKEMKAEGSVKTSEKE